MVKKIAKLTEHSLGVILEDIDSKFQQVLEGQYALENKFDKKIDKLNDKVDILYIGHKALTESHKTLTERLGDLSKSSKQILSYLSRIDDEIQDIKAGLRQKADLNYVRQLEARVVKIELAVQKNLHNN